MLVGVRGTLGREVFRARARSRRTRCAKGVCRVRASRRRVGVARARCAIYACAGVHVLRWQTRIDHDDPGKYRKEARCWNHRESGAVHVERGDAACARRALIIEEQSMAGRIHLDVVSISHRRKCRQRGCANARFEFFDRVGRASRESNGVKRSGVVIAREDGDAL